MNEGISRSKAKAVTADIELAIQTVLEAHGLTQEKVSTKYGSNYEVRVVANFAVLNDKGVNIRSEYAQEFLVFAQYNPLFDGVDAKDVLGTRYFFQGQEYIFEGWNSRAPRFPVVATRVHDGAKYKQTDGVLNAVVEAYRTQAVNR